MGEERGVERAEERRVRIGREGGEIKGTTITAKHWKENKIKRNKRQGRREMLFSPQRLWDVPWV